MTDPQITRRESFRSCPNCGARLMIEERYWGNIPASSDNEIFVHRYRCPTCRSYEDMDDEKPELSTLAHPRLVRR